MRERERGRERNEFERERERERGRMNGKILSAWKESVLKNDQKSSMCVYMTYKRESMYDQNERERERERVLPFEDHQERVGCVLTIKLQRFLRRERDRLKNNE